MDSTTGLVNNRGKAILSICIACGVIQTFAVALRFLARRRIKTRLQIDDWFIFASLWPNYVMIVLGGFREYNLVDIQCHGYGLIPILSGWRRQSWIADSLPYPSREGRLSSGLECKQMTPSSIR